MVNWTNMTPRLKPTIQARTIIVIIASFIFVSGVLGYIYYRSKSFVQGPTISIESPVNGSSVTEALTEIKGQAQNVSSITVNGKKIFIDEKGIISEKLLLSQGYNIISVKAEDRFNRQVERTLEVIYRP